MRLPVFLPLLCALLPAAAELPVRGDDLSPEPIRIAVPDELTFAVIDGDALYALTGKNELVRVDLQAQKTTTVVAFPTEAKAETLTVADGKACIGARDDKGAVTLQIVDLTGGKITDTLPKDAGRRGFIIGDRVYTVNGISVRIFKASTGDFMDTIEIGGGVLSDSYRVGDRLYIAREYAGGFAVIDLKKGKLLDLIETKDWLFQVRVGKDKAFVWGEFSGTGEIDLKTREYAALEPPLPNETGQTQTLQAGPDGGLLVLSDNPKMRRVYQYDAAGKRVGQTDIEKGGKLIGAWNDCAVFVLSKQGSANKNLVELVPLAKPQKKSD